MPSTDDNQFYFLLFKLPYTSILDLNQCSKAVVKRLRKNVLKLNPDKLVVTLDEKADILEGLDPFFSR